MWLNGVKVCCVFYTPRKLFFKPLIYIYSGPDPLFPMIICSTYRVLQVHSQALSTTANHPFLFLSSIHPIGHRFPKLQFRRIHYDCFNHWLRVHLDGSSGQLRCVDQCGHPDRRTVFLPETPLQRRRQRPHCKILQRRNRRHRSRQLEMPQPPLRDGRL